MVTNTYFVMSTKILKRQLNGAQTKSMMTTGELMENPEKALPSEVMKENNISPSTSKPNVEPPSQKPAKVKAKKKVSTPPDMGHNVNYDNFGQLIYYVTDIATPPYNPPGTRLPLASLELKHAETDLALQKVQQKEDAETMARNQRQLVFAPAEALGARVRGQLAACGADKKVLKDYRTFMNEFTGKRAVPIDPTDGSKHISNSHTTFANRIWAWNGIVTLCTGFPGYESNEPELSLAGLNAVKDAMVSTNAAVQEAKSAAKMARDHRDQVMYAPITGLVPVALDVKEYVKALFGYKSPQFRMVNHIRFRNLMGK